MAEPLINEGAQVNWRKVYVGSAFSFVAGYVDANTKVRFGTYGGMMTGNTVSLAMAIQSRDLLSTLLFMTIIGCFEVGVVLGARLISAFGGKQAAQGRSGLPSQVKPVLAFTMALFLLACDGADMALGEDLESDRTNSWTRFASALTAISMGTQNVVSMSSNLKQNTTVVTGNLQKLGEVVERKVGGHAGAADSQTGRQLAFGWATYVGGGIVGAAAAHLFASCSLCPIVVAQLLALFTLNCL